GRNSAVRRGAASPQRRGCGLERRSGWRRLARMGAGIAKGACCFFFPRRWALDRVHLEGYGDEFSATRRSVCPDRSRASPRGWGHLDFFGRRVDPQGVTERRALESRAKRTPAG